MDPYFKIKNKNLYIIHIKINNLTNKQMYKLSISCQEGMNIIDNDILEKKKRKLEMNYMQCLKEYYSKNELMANTCDVYVKEYEKISKKMG